MKEFKVKAGKSEVTFNFPNTIDELSVDYLTKVTDNLTIADNYSLIALVYQDRLAPILLAGRSGKQNQRFKVIPLFIKAGNTDVEFINEAKIKDKVVITPSQLSLGIHVKLPYHKLDLDYFISLITMEGNKGIYEKEIANEDQRPCLFVEFKLVPNADIAGFIKNDLNKVDDMYVNVVDVTNEAGA